ncbi:MAG: hypothetical protein ACTSPM_00825 [Candidatus Heimdallarchaeota archaeon]
MRKSTISKAIFFVVAITFLVVWNVGCYHVIAQRGIDFITPASNSTPGNANLDTNVVGVIDPPLGNATKPGIGAMFSLMALVLPTEIALVFIAEILLGTSMGLDPKKKSLTRLGIMLGSAGAISVISGIVHYLLVYPAIHDLPIHTKTYLEQRTGVEVEGVFIPEVWLPQYGDAATFNSLGLDIFFLILAAIIIIGIHYPAYRYIQGMNNTTSIVSLALPLIAYPIVWAMLVNQVTVKAFYETTGTVWTMTALISGGLVLFFTILLIWKLTLMGTAPKEEKNPTEPQTELMP